MSFRPALLALTLALFACDEQVPAGPERERANVFNYAVALAPGQTLALRNLAGRLQIEPAADDTLRIVADLKWRGDSTPPDDLKFTSSALPDGVLVCAYLGKGRCTREDFDAHVNGGELSIGTGGLKLGMGGRTQAEVTFRVQVPAGVKLDLVQVEGDIASASTAPVKVRGVNGTITVVTSVGPVDAKTVNGTIDARMTTLTGSDSVNVELVNGDAYVFIPETAAATVDIGAVNGTVLSDFTGIAGGRNRLAKTITGVVGAGTTPVRVRTLNGNAQLRRLDAAGRAYEIDPPPGG
jgi:hypothetical protein